MAANKLPETLVLNLSFEVDREWIEEYIAEGEEVTLQMMLDALREQALESLDDDSYNMVHTSDVLDENGKKVWSTDMFFES
jgi:hypothetical protein